MKKLIAVILSALVMVSAFSVNAFAQEYIVECSYNSITGQEIKTLVPKAVENSEITHCATDISNSEVDDILYSKCCSDYGYKDLALRENGEAKQKAYELILKSAKAFFEGDKTLSNKVSTGQFLIEKIPFDDNNDFQYYLTNQQLYEAYFTFRKDNPLFYFSSTTVIVNGYYADKDGDGFNDKYENGELILYVTTISYLTEEDYRLEQSRAECKTKIISHLFEYSQYLDSYLSPYSKIEALNKKLCDEITYAREDGGAASSAAWAHNIMGVFDDEINSAVCEGYTYAFDIIMGYIGLDSIIINGLANGESHAWNLVRLDDEYFYVDSTWNDTTDNSYFLKGTDSFYLDHSIETPNGVGIDFLYQLPQVSADDYNPIDLESSELNFKQNEQGKLSFTILPSYPSANVKITSDNPEIIEINQNGEFIVLSKGETSITIKTADNKFSKTVAVSVISEKGDINSDNEINIRDVVMLFQSVSKWDVTIDEASADVNGDDTVNIRDVVLLYQYVSGWNVEI